MPPSANRTGLFAIPGFLILCCAMIVNGMGQSLVFAVIPMLGRELQLDELVISAPWLGFSWSPRELAITSLSSVTALVASIGAPIWGRASDQYGRKQIVIVGLVGYALGALLFSGALLTGLLGWVEGLVLWLLLVVTRMIHAGVVSAAHPASNAYIADVTTPQQRTRGIGAINAATQVGVMAGPVLVYFVVIHLLAPLLIHAVVMLLCALLIWLKLPAVPLRPRSPGRRYGLSYFDQRFRVYMVIGFSMYLMLAMAQATLAFYIQDAFQLELEVAAQRFSIALMVSSGAMVAAQWLIVNRLGWGPRRLLNIGLPVVGVGYLGLALAQTLPHIWTSMAMFGLGMGLAVPGFMAGASMAVQADEQGSVAGLCGSMAGLGYLFGPLIGGYLYSLHHEWPFWFAAVALIPLSVYAMRARQR